MIAPNTREEALLRCADIARHVWHAETNMQLDRASVYRTLESTFYAHEIEGETDAETGWVIYCENADGSDHPGMFWVHGGRVAYFPDDVDFFDRSTVGGMTVEPLCSVAIPTD